MVEAKEKHILQYNEFPKISNQDLLLIEEWFIGGSEDINGVFYDTRRLKEDFLRGKLPNEYFQPVNVLKGTKPLEEVVGDRKGKYIRGALGFLGESGMDVYEEGFETAIELAEMDSETNLFIPKWRIFLLQNNKQVVNSRILANLSPIGILSEVLVYDHQPDGIVATLNQKL